MFGAEFVKSVVSKQDGDIFNTIVYMHPVENDASREFYKSLKSSGQLEVRYCMDGVWNVVSVEPPSMKSLCIPRAHSSTREWQVADKFNSIFGGEYVKHIEMKEKKDNLGVAYFTVFIHFHQDRFPESAQRFYKLLFELDERKDSVKVSTGHKDHFWKVVPYKPQAKSAQVTQVKPDAPKAPKAPLKSVCIPRAMITTTEADIQKVFNDLFGGPFVERVDLREKKDQQGVAFYTAFIHFSQELEPTDKSNRFYSELYASDEKKESVKVLTGVRHYFWKVVPNKAAVRTGPAIMSEEEEKEFLVWKKASEAFDSNRSEEYLAAQAEAIAEAEALLEKLEIKVE
jgi:hypothetical protein